MCTAMERVLPRTAYLSTTFSFCPITVMFGALYGFPGAGWCTTSLFFVLIVNNSYHMTVRPDPFASELVFLSISSA